MLEIDYFLGNYESDEDIQTLRIFNISVNNEIFSKIQALSENLKNNQFGEISVTTKPEVEVNSNKTIQIMHPSKIIPIIYAAPPEIHFVSPHHCTDWTTYTLVG